MDDPRLLHIAPEDNVCVAVVDLVPGEVLSFAGASIPVAADVPRGHKVCVRALRPGDKVIKYGASIGSATRAIAVGEHVHTHNLASDYLPADGRKEHEEPVG